MRNLNLLQALTRLALLGENKNKNDLELIKKIKQQEAEFLCAHGLAWIAFNYQLEHRLNKPDQEIEQIIEYVHPRVKLQLLAVKALTELGKEFRANRITAASTRSLGCAARLYPKPECRMGSDVDLLIAERDLQRAEKTFSQLGFKPKTPAPDISYVRHGLTIDLALRPSDIVRMTGIEGEEDLFQHLDACWQEHLVSGDIPGINEFSLPFEFVTSALHYLYKHQLSRHIWGTDLLLLAKKMNSEELQVCAELITKTECENFIKAAVKHVEELFACEIPPEIGINLQATRRQPILKMLLKKSYRTKPGNDLGYLIALVASPNFNFKLQMLKKMLFPPAGDFKRQGISHNTVGNRERIKHFLSLPVRFLKSLFS